MLDELDWWDHRSGDFLNQHLIGSKKLVRIATGFFSAGGYEMVRRHFQDCRLNIFVGYDERSRQNLVQSFLEEFLAQLGRWHEDRYATIVAITSKLQAGELRVMDARARNRDHAKVYIVDNRKAIVGSVNLTQNGLQYNFEGATVVTDPDQVANWITKFEHYWNAPDTVDISAQLLERLLAWLELRSPWEVYLKAASELLAAEPPTKPRETYRQPAEYQMVVIKRTLRQLREHRGAQIVASTGLGKTVMGTQIAVELKDEGRIGNVLVIGPKAVAKEWEERLESGEVAVRTYTTDILDKNVKTGARGETKDLVERLQRLDDRWLLIVDESHRFKNRFKGPGKERLSFARLLPAISKSNCYMLLLTATPYAAEKENINNQLLLLPHTSPDTGDRLPFAQDAHAWRVTEVETLSELPVATVFNTPYVAKNYARRDPQTGADYITYPDNTRRFLPQLLLRRIHSPLPVEQLMIPLLNERLFRHDWATIYTREGPRKKDDTVEERVAISWASSPWELERVLTKVANDEYDVKFIAPLAVRQRKLQPVLQALRSMTHEDDAKFMRAYAVIRAELQKGNKVVVYSERYATAAYIEAGVRLLLPAYADRIACAVEKKRGEWGLKDHDQQVEPMIRHFAPRANPYEDGRLPENRFDIFIATDAYAEGVNLQDGSVLVSYDIAWTADTIIQRAGRIMRFWHEPRQVQLNYFTVDKKLNEQVGHVASRPSHRLRRLEQRLEQANKLTEIPILPEDQIAYDSLRQLSTIQISERELELELLEAPELSEVSKVLEDYTQLNLHRDEAEALPDDIATAFYSKKVGTPTLVSVVKTGSGYALLHYQPENESLKQISENDLFHLIRCEPTTQRAPIDPSRVESARHEASTRWLEQSQNNAESAKHICSAYLVPHGMDDLIDLTL